MPTPMLRKPPCEGVGEGALSSQQGARADDAPGLTASPRHRRPGPLILAAAAASEQVHCEHRSETPGSVERPEWARRVEMKHSQYRGVTWRKDNCKWVAQIKIGGKLNYLGLYEKEADAARAYDARAR